MMPEPTTRCHHLGRCSCSNQSRLIAYLSAIPSDRDAFYGYMKREEYWRDIPIGPPTLEWVQSLVQRCLEEQAVSPRTNYFLAAVCKQTGVVIGEAILRIESFWHCRGEIGWG